MAATETEVYCTVSHLQSLGITGQRLIGLCSFLRAITTCPVRDQETKMHETPFGSCQSRCDGARAFLTRQWNEKTIGYPRDYGALTGYNYRGTKGTVLCIHKRVIH